jgi:phage FluMu protein Com|tara:strand:- start:8489 stop:8701 length:213 start_codon:yes stop_codon:yes gene_type:complete
MKEAMIHASFELWAECPHCKDNVDILDCPHNDQDGELLSPLTNNKWGKMEGVEVECPECKKMFKIKEVVY